MPTVNNRAHHRGTVMRDKYRTIVAVYQGQQERFRCVPIIRNTDPGPRDRDEPFSHFQKLRDVLNPSLSDHGRFTPGGSTGLPLLGGAAAAGVMIAPSECVKPV